MFILYLRVTMGSTSKSLCLLIVIVPFFCNSVVADYLRFGCRFLNSNYTSIVNQRSIFDATYGKIVEPLLITRQDLYEVTHKITSLNRAMLINILFNTMDPYLQFYDSYLARKNEPSFNFSSFFDSYQPPHIPTLPFVPIASLFNTLIDYHYNILGNHVYLATTVSAVSDTIITKLECLAENPIWFEHEYIVGVLRISVEGRSGYVIVDNKLGAKSVVYTVMDDGLPLDDDALEAGSSSQAAYSRNALEESSQDAYSRNALGESSQDISSINAVEYGSQEGGQRFRLTESKQFLVYTEPDGKKTVSFIGRPFCSLLESTTKTGLLTGIKKLSKTNKRGETVASVFIWPSSQRYPEFSLLLKDNRLVHPIIKTVGYPELNGISLNQNEYEDASLINVYNEVQRLLIGAPTCSYHSLREILVSAEPTVSNRDFLANVEALQQYIMYQRSRLFSN